MILNVKIHLKCIRICSRNIDLNRVIDDQIDRNLWIDLLWIAAHLDHRITKCSKINNSRNTGKILQNDTRRTEWNFSTLTIGLPSSNRLDIFFSNQKSITVAKCTFQQDTHRVRKMLGGNSSIIKGRKGVISASNLKFSLRQKWVQFAHDSKGIAPR